MLRSSLILIEKNIFTIAAPSQQIYVQLQADAKLFEIKPHAKMLLDNLNLIANGTFNGYVVTNGGQLTLKDTEMSTHGNSNSNAQIVNKLSGAIYMEGINLLRKE